MDKELLEQDRMRQEILAKQKRIDQEALEKQRLKDLEEQRALAAQASPRCRRMLLIPMPSFNLHNASLCLVASPFPVRAAVSLIAQQVAKKRAEDSMAANPTAASQPKQQVPVSPPPFSIIIMILLFPV